MACVQHVASQHAPHINTACRGLSGAGGGRGGTPAGQYEWRIRQRRRWGGGKVFKPQEVSALLVPALLSPPSASSYSDHLFAGVRNINAAPSDGPVLLWLLNCLEDFLC